MTMQVPAPEGLRASVTRLQLASLILGGGSLGLRLARLGNPVVAAVVIAGVLGLLGLLIGAIKLFSRQRVARARANWPGSAAVSAQVNVGAMLAPGRKSDRARDQKVSVILILLPDRMILVPGWWMAHRCGLAALDLPLDKVVAASWLTGYSGLRQIPMLELTGHFGEPVIIRFAMGYNRATAAFITAMKATLPRWLPVTALTDRTNPVSPHHLLRVGAPLVVAGIVVSTVGGYVAGGVLINKTPSVQSMSDSIRPDREIGVPGYYTYGGPKPVQFGAPYGPPCQPVLVRFEKSVPDAPYQSFVDVVHEARAAGININIAVRNSKLTLGERLIPGLHADAVQTAMVSADQKAPTRLPSGEVQHLTQRWGAFLSADGRHEYVANPNILLHLGVLGWNTSAFRKAALGFVGLTQGIAVSTARGSAFAARFTDGANRFSPQDISAMLTMSGCAPKARQLFVSRLDRGLQVAGLGV